MKYRPRRGAPFAEGDMTPMIDMTFQLIAFFMVLVNLTEYETSELINLPISAMAQAPNTPPATKITIQVTKAKGGNPGKVVLNGEIFTPTTLTTRMKREYNAIDSDAKRDATEATIIIRGDEDATAGLVQDVIISCQLAKFQNFVLRAEEPN